MTKARVLAVVGRTLLDRLAPTRVLEPAAEVAAAVVGSGPVPAEILGDLPELRTLGVEAPTITLLAPEAWQESVGRWIGRSVEPDVKLDLVTGPSGDAAELLGGRVDVLRCAGLVFNADAGPEDQRRVLAPLLDAYEVRTKGTRPDGALLTMPRPAFSRSRLFGALHFCETAQPGAVAARQAEEGGFAGLILATPAGYRPSPALLDLVADDRLKAQPDYYSASATLLDRVGAPDLADRLRSLIRLWLRHRLWSVNFVPEMVLHNEEHAVAVDRNVAFICEPLVDTEALAGKPNSAGVAARLTPHDVFLLAVAAWLHDWGHASAQINSAYENDPMDVRELHGYLTRVRILADGSQQAHGLSDDNERKLVALLCSHHQGKSSCDAEAAPALTAAMEPLGWTQQQLGYSLRDDHQHLMDENRRRAADDVEAEYARLQRLVAILRVADAADIGAHRVPDYENQDGNQDPRVATFIEARAEVLRWMVAAGAEDDNVKRGLTARLRRMGGHYTSLMESVGRQDYWSEDDLEKLVTRYEAQHDPGGAPDRVDDEARKSAKAQVRRAWEYAKYVALQRGFYRSHRRFEVAFPVVLPNPGDKTFSHRLELVTILAQDEPHPDKAREYLAGIVKREFGLVNSPDPEKRKDERRRKGRVEECLNELGIATDNLQARPVSPSDRPAPGKPWPGLLPGRGGLVRSASGGLVGLTVEEGVVRHERWPSDAPGDEPLVLSADGRLAARWVDEGVQFTRIDARGRVQSPDVLGLVADAPGFVLAVQTRADGLWRILVWWPDEVLLLGSEDDDVRAFPGEWRPCGALVDDHVVLVDRDGVATEILSSGARTTPPWLLGLDVVGLDTVQTADGPALAALGGDTVRAARRQNGTWRPARSLAAPAGATGVLWIRDDAGPATLVVTRDAGLSAFGLSGEDWRQVAGVS